jgi:hypothetical protein
MNADIVDIMVGRIRAERVPMEPWHVAARRVWNTSAIDDVSREAFEEVGRAAIENEGTPAEYPPEQGDNLGFLGFLSISAERISVDDA